MRTEDEADLTNGCVSGRRAQKQLEGCWCSKLAWGLDGHPKNNSPIAKQASQATTITQPTDRLTKSSQRTIMSSQTNQSPTPAKQAKSKPRFNQPTNHRQSQTNKTKLFLEQTSKTKTKTSSAQPTTQATKQASKQLANKLTK